MLRTEMDPVDKHSFAPNRSFDGGNLDCGSGLLLLIRENLDKLEPGQLLEICSSETSVEEDLPAWCRLTNNDLLSWTRKGKQRSFLVCKGKFDTSTMPADTTVAGGVHQGNSRSTNVSVSNSSVTARNSRPAKADWSQFKLDVPPFSVMGIGSWPRPIWLMPYLHKHLEGKITDDDFNTIANDAVRLCVQAQMRSGAAIITDGEQRRDNYASFVGLHLHGCKLIPISDLLPLVDDPLKFQEELKSLDVPADKVRHPAVMGRLSRKSNLAVDELLFVKSICAKPVKIALPGPYLLTRLMWMDCITDKVYSTREELSADVVCILQEEITDLLNAGAAIVQLDEPVLSEIVFTGAKNSRSFMCGALSERGNTTEELEFATSLINAVCSSFPKERLAMHVCRGNWTPDESAALTGDYDPLVTLFNSVNVGTLFLEFCTSRAGSLEVLRNLRADLRIGLGAVNQKDRNTESVEAIVAHAKKAASILGAGRVLLNPDCGFATFADNPVSSAEIAEDKLIALCKAAKILQEEFPI